MTFVLSLFLAVAMAAPGDGDNCDQQARNYANKNGCYLEGDPARCILLAGNSGAATAGGLGAASGAYAAKAMAGLKGDAKFVQGFNENLTRVQQLNTAQREAGQLQQTLKGLNTEKERLAAVREKLALLTKSGDANSLEARKRLQSVLESGQGTVENRLLVLSKDLLAELDKTSNKFFPNDPELEKIYKRYEEMVRKRTEALENRMAEYTQRRNQLYAELKKARANNLPEREAEIRKSMEKLEESNRADNKAYNDVQNQVADKVMPKNPKLSLLLKLLQLRSAGGVHTHPGLAAKAMEETNKAFEQNKAENSRMVRYGIAGVGLGTLVGVGLYSRGQVDVRLCQEALQLSDNEVSFLTKDKWVSPAKAHNKGLGCDTMMLANPEETIEEAIAKFGSVPKGLCGIIKNQDKYLDHLMGKQSMSPQISCESFKDVNVRVADGFYEYTEKDSVYKAPYSEVLNYPDFRFVKVYDREGKEKKLQSLELQGKYNRIHPANVTNPRPDIDDLALVCRPNDRGFSCPLVQGAARARVGRSLADVGCKSNESGSSKSSGPSMDGVGDEGQR